ncbi:lamin tail domain-containing protein [Nocardioides mesophilus]|uniref:lamin tail domain-containing protein n=1 Tax=Nocardioides mesophilus TaxID=433659 RepID=UPI001FEB53D2|nr:lamin tail domain-containing protein [Nocardioides mesophilus]
MPLSSVDAAAISPVRFSYVQYDSPGTDTGSNRSLNAEYVVVKNFGQKSRSITGWTVRDLNGHVYRFGRFTIKPGKTVRLHTGRGSNSRTDVYWRRDWYVWNNTGDKATLKNKSGTTVDTCKWGDGDGNTAC